MAIDDETLYGLKGKQIKQVVEEIKESEAAFKPFPDSVVTDGTTEQFMNSILALNEPVGTAFLGTVSLSDLPAGLLQEEVAVYVYSDYVVYCEVKSTDVAPYAWWCASYNYQGWRPVNTDTTYSAGAGLNLNGTTFSVNTTTIQEKLDSTQMSAVNSGIDSTKVGQIATNASDIDTIEGKIPSAATAQNQLADKTYVDTADNGLQSQIDAISASSDVKDIVGTKAELDNYDTSTLGDNDIIKVLQDESENDATTYYRWSTSTNSFTLIGEEGPYYTKSQANALLDDKVDKVTGKGLSENDFTTTLKDKLDGLEAGAEVNEIDSISVNGTAVTPDANKNVALTIDEGIKTLTTADYNYPVANPDRIALNYLSAGVYKIAPNTNYTTLGTDSTVYTPYTGVPSLAIVLPVGGSSTVENRVSIIHTDSNGYTKLAYAARNSAGQPSSNYVGTILGTKSIVNNLTSTSSVLPLSAAQGKYLNDNKADKTVFTGTDGTTAGTMGLVPAPATTDAGKVLSSDGSWTTPDAGIKTLTTEDYNSPSANPTHIDPELLEDGVYKISVPSGTPSVRIYPVYYNDNSSEFRDGGVLIKSSTAYLYNLGNEGRWWSGAKMSPAAQLGVVDSLASTANNLSLSARQGKILNDRIGTLSSLTTTAKTSAVAAINELDSDLAKTQALSGSGAPTTSTAGTVGQFYVDTATGDIYYLSAIVEESGQPDSYTWNKVATGSVATIVQNTGNSTTNVMSQNAVTKTIFADTQNSRNIKIGYNASNTSGSNAGVAIGEHSNVSAGYGIALGHYAWAEAGNSIAIGGGTGTSEAPRVRAAHAVAIGDHIDARRCDYSVCIGQYLNGGSSMEYDGSIALGAYSGGSITAVGMMDIGSSNTSYGYNSSNYRLLTGLHDPQSAHDAATKGYVDSHSATTLTNSEFNTILENA